MGGDDMSPPMIPDPPPRMGPPPRRPPMRMPPMMPPPGMEPPYEKEMKMRNLIQTATEMESHMIKLGKKAGLTDEELGLKFNTTESKGGKDGKGKDGKGDEDSLLVKPKDDKKKKKKKKKEEEEEE